MSFSEVKYLLGILNFEGKNVSLIDLSKYLNVKPPSSFEMIKKLEEKKMINYNKSTGIRLTTEGLTEASKLSFRYQYWKNQLGALLSLNNIEHEDLASLFTTSKFDLEISNIIEKDSIGKITNINFFEKSVIGFFDEMQEGFAGVIDSIDSNIPGLVEACKKKNIEEGVFVKIISKSLFDDSCEIMLGDKEIVISSKISGGLIVSSEEYLVLKKSIDSKSFLGKEGSLIPGACSFKKDDLVLEALEGLSNCDVGYVGVIKSINNLSEDQMSLLQKKGINLEAQVEILDKSDFDGFIELLINKDRKASISEVIAKNILCICV